MIDPKRPKAPSPSDGSGRSLNFLIFCMNNAGAFPSLDSVTNKLVTPNSEAVIVEKPAMMIAPLKTSQFTKKSRGKARLF